MARAVTVIVIAGLFAMSVLPSYGGEPWPDDIRRIKERGELVVAQYHGVEPVFFFFDDAKEFPDQPSYVHEGRRLVGCDIALAHRIADELGVRLRFERTAKDYDTVCRYVAQGTADLGISMLSITPRRAQYVRFSSSYAVTHVGILMDRLHVSGLKGGDPFLTLCRGRGTKMGILEGCSYVDVAKELCPSSSLVYYPDFPTMLNGVMGGKVHALFDDEFQIRTTLHRNPELAVRLKYVEVPEFQDRIGIAVSPQCPNLLAFVNVVLDSDRVRSKLAKMLQLFTKGTGSGRTQSVPKDPSGNTEAVRSALR
jgi:polar amino acid transport system substrate-binding protein